MTGPGEEKEAAPASLVDMIGTEGPTAGAALPGPAAWIKIAVLAALTAWLSWDEIRQMVNGWLADPSWSHGFIIPLFSLYLLYNWRDEIFAAVGRTAWWGLAVVLAAIGAKAFCQVVVRVPWLAQLTIPVLVFGLILFLGGWKLAYVTAVPVFFIALAMPLPDRLYRMMSLPMQDLAARVSGGIMRLFGADIEVTRSVLSVTSVSGEPYSLQVAEACSGMRSLMAFVALGVAMAYIQHRPLWQRIVIIGAGIPIAIACNILRVTATCTMYVWDYPELGMGVMHYLMGIALLIPALIMLFLLVKVLDMMYEEVEEENPEEKP